MDSCGAGGACLRRVLAGRAVGRERERERERVARSARSLPPWQGPPEAKRDVPPAGPGRTGRRAARERLVKIVKFLDSKPPYIAFAEFIKTNIMTGKESGALSGGAIAGITLGAFVGFCALFRYFGDEKNVAGVENSIESVEEAETEESTGKTAEVVIAGETEGSSSEKQAEEGPEGPEGPEEPEYAEEDGGEIVIFTRMQESKNLRT